MHAFENSELFNPIVAIFLKYFFKNKFAELQMQFFQQFTSAGSKANRSLRSIELSVAKIPRHRWKLFVTVGLRLIKQ